MADTDPRSDEELVARANDGDAAAFEALYDRHRDWVLHHALRFCGHEDAQDVLQESFAYLLQKFPGFELRARMTTFLYPVVRHIAIRIRERRRRHEPEAAAELEPAGVETAPAPEADATSGRHAVQRIVAALPETHREVLLLRFVDELSLQEIAAALEIPLGTVKSRLHNALRRLQEDPRLRAEFE